MRVIALITAVEPLFQSRSQFCNHLRYRKPLHLNRSTTLRSAYTCVFSMGASSDKKPSLPDAYEVPKVWKFEPQEGAMGKLLPMPNPSLNIRRLG